MIQSISSICFLSVLIEVFSLANSFFCAEVLFFASRYLTYYKDINSAVFDGACMYIDNFGSSYTYNDDGRLVSTSDGTGQGIFYTYDGPDLTKVSQKFDGEEKESCTYTYDDSHNLLTETAKSVPYTCFLKSRNVGNGLDHSVNAMTQFLKFSKYETVRRIKL